MKIISASLICLLLFSSCNSQKDEELIKDCDGLAMLYYRGLPNPSKLYKKHCQSKEDQLEYNPNLCKRALGDLMLNGSERRLKKMFGDRVMECFNEGDLERFLRPEPKKAN
jgi:hypothetical protein